MLGNELAMIWRRVCPFESIENIPQLTRIRLFHQSIGYFQFPHRV